MDGVLVIDKPAGMTSHDVVDAIRKRLKTRRVGHGGTLDPDATGVLLLGVGKATRFLSFAQASPKRYEAEVRLGLSTTTQDASGEPVESRPVTATQADIEAALPAFTGAIEQIPPMVSAVRVGGERLYEKARRGEDVVREPRAVTVYELTLGSYLPETATAVLEVKCSGGTYIRTLAHDLGERLGCGAHLVTLRRTEAAGWGLEDATPLDQASDASLRPLADVVRDMPRLELDEEAARLVSYGRSLELDTDLEQDALAALVRDGKLLGVYRRQSDKLVPERVVAT